ncbi:MAG: hypothetical protein ACLFRG_04435 [Desulfococcaceae bacterium]
MAVEAKKKRPHRWQFDAAVWRKKDEKIRLTIPESKFGAIFLKKHGREGFSIYFKWLILKTQPWFFFPHLPLAPMGSNC